MLTSTSKATAPELRSSISRTAVPAPFQSQNYSSNAVLLQGVPNSALPNLFLIADGAGSAASYLHLPPLPSGLPVYALESPFLQYPEQYTCTIEEISAIFVRVIQQIQPSGPYLIGGWSIGGTYTYEIIRQLAILGEKTHGVLIIDGACPKAMHGLPEITIEVLEEMGIFVGTPMKDGGHQPMKTKQKKHILGCVKAVTKYDPIPLELEWYPHHTVLLWSRRGMFEKLTGKLKEELELLGEKEEGKEKTGINRDWLSGERTSFGPKGWDKLLGVRGMECHAIDGDHFSIMNMPAVSFIPTVLFRSNMISNDRRHLDQIGHWPRCSKRG
jgi:thioesterase domain-containing protein